MKKTLIIIPAVLLMAGGVLSLVTAASYMSHLRQDGAGGSSGPVYEHGDWQSAKWIEDFTLTERSGKLFHSRDMKGKVWAVGFFFASCPSVCRQQNTRVAELAREYGPKGVTFVNITVDPQRDTPAVLREYAHGFQVDEKHWLFLTGDLLHIRRIGAEMFQLPTEEQRHSERLTVVDRWGKIRGTYHWTDYEQVTALKQKLDELLAETEPPPDVEQPAESKPHFDDETGRFISDES